MEAARRHRRCRVVKGGLRVHLIPKVAHSSIGNTIGEMVIDNVYPDEESDDYRIMVVRHPLDRIVSSWAFFNYKRAGHKLTSDIKHFAGWNTSQPMPFELWCKTLLEHYAHNAHFDKQIMFTGGQKIDELIAMEHLNTRWPEIAKRFNLPAIKFENRSDHDSWETYYTPELRAEAEAVFHEDVELYNLSLEK